MYHLPGGHASLFLYVPFCAVWRVVYRFKVCVHVEIRQVTLSDVIILAILAKLEYGQSWNK